MRRIAAFGRGLGNLPKHVLVHRPIHRRRERLGPTLVQRNSGGRNDHTASRRRRSPAASIARATTGNQIWTNRKAGDQGERTAHREPRSEGGISYASRINLDRAGIPIVKSKV